MYLARDRFLARQVAVKILHPDLSRDKRFLTRFRREAESAAALNHPHIVGVYDVGDDGELYYIVMEYVQGVDLKELLIQSGPLPPRRAADVGFQIASALEYAHGRGLVHRDIKPHNVMVAPSGLVKVADFGIATLLSERTPTDDSSVLGSAQYLSPEQAQGGPVTPLSDVYSLGVVLYEAVSGFLPFPGDNPVQVATAHVRETPIPPSTLKTDVPPELDRIILRALEKEPRRRWASAEEMGRALQERERDAFSAPTTLPQRVKSANGNLRPAAVGAPVRKRSSGCVTRMIGLLTLLAVIGIVPASVWVLDNGGFGAAPVVSPPTPTPVVVAATSTPRRPSASASPYSQPAAPRLGIATPLAAPETFGPNAPPAAPTPAPVATAGVGDEPALQASATATR